MPFEDSTINDKNEVKALTMKFGKPGDGFKGTLLAIKTVEVNVEKNGVFTKVAKNIYEFRAHAGAFHDIAKDAVGNDVPVEPEIIVPEGEIVKLWTRGKMFDDDMKHVKCGMIVAFKFTAYAVAKPGKRPAKIVKIYKGGVDPNYMGEDAAALVEAEFNENQLPPV